MGEGDLVRLLGAPAADDKSATVRSLPDLIHHVTDLIEPVALVGAVRVEGCTEVPPQVAVHRPELAGGSAEPCGLLLGRPFVPDAHPGLLERCDMGLSSEEPKQLVGDGLEVQLLCGEEGEPSGQVDSVLVAEDAERARAGAVLTGIALVEETSEKVEVHLHAPRYRGPEASVQLSRCPDQPSAVRPGWGYGSGPT